MIGPAVMCLCLVLPNYNEFDHAEKFMIGPAIMFMFGPAKLNIYILICWSYWWILISSYGAIGENKMILESLEDTYLLL